MNWIFRMLSETLFFSTSNAALIAIGLGMVLLALYKDYEPAFFIPLGFGTILVNMPHFGQITGHGLWASLSELGIQSNIFPILLLISIGAMLDFEYLLARPALLLYGIAGQLGIIIAFTLGPLFGLDSREAASIGMIATLNPPASIMISAQLSPDHLAVISLAVFFYRSILPAILLKLASVGVRKIDWNDVPRPQPHRTSSIITIVFPIFITIIFGLFLPGAALLIGMLMLGYLLKESNLLQNLARIEFSNLVTILLGITIGLNLTPGTFFTRDILLVFGLSVVALTLNLIAAFLFGKLMERFSHGKINPLLCMAGIVPGPIPSKHIAHIANQQGYGDRFIEPAMAINSGALLTNVLLGCIFITILA